MSARRKAVWPSKRTTTEECSDRERRSDGSDAARPARGWREGEGDGEGGGG